MIATIILVVLLCLVAWQVYETINAYRRATGTTWERLKAAFSESATIAWARLNALSAVAVAVLLELSAWLGAPGVQQSIEPYLGPKYMLAYLLVVLVGAEIARRRSLSA
jgi:hypothetical protein